MKARVVLAQAAHHVGRPSAMALSLCCTASSARFWVFCNNATSRNVTIVVTVLMINCQVSTVSNRKIEGNHTTTNNRQSRKNHARETKSLATVAKTVKN